MEIIACGVAGIGVGVKVAVGSGVSVSANAASGVQVGGKSTGARTNVEVGDRTVGDEQPATASIRNKIPIRFCRIFSFL